jgi:hypothetical protein
MLCGYAGFDPTESSIIPRSPASRFTPEQIGGMLQMAADGASGVEIAHALDLRPQSVRAKLSSLGVRLRRRVARTRLRMVIRITKRMRIAADARGVTVQQLIRRLLRAISRDNLFDTILPLSVPRSLGAAVTNEPQLRWLNQPPIILRHVELGGCIETPRLAICLAQPRCRRNDAV